MVVLGEAGRNISYITNNGPLVSQRDIGIWRRGMAISVGKDVGYVPHGAEGDGSYSRSRKKSEEKDGVRLGGVETKQDTQVNHSEGVYKM